MAEFNPREQAPAESADPAAGRPSVGARPNFSMFSFFANLFGGGGQNANPSGAAELGNQYAEGSGAPVEDPAKRAQDQQAKTAEKPSALPETERQQQKEQTDLEAKAHDPNASMSDKEVEKLAEQADPQKMKPEDVLKMRGISPTAIDTIKNSGNLDAQETVQPGQPDMHVWEGKTKRDMTPGEVEASHTNREGDKLPAMSEEQKSNTVAAQSALSEDMKVGADVRKAIPMASAADMLAGVRDPSMFGDFGLKRNTEGQTPMEAAATLGLDYQGSPYVKDGADGKKTFSDTVKNEGIMMIDTVMTPEMLAKAQVPLGHDVMNEARDQAAALHEQQKSDPSVVIPPLLQMDAEGKKMTHAFERNRTGSTDPRTGAGNSTVEHQELLAEAEAQRPGEQVNVVNQEMKIGGAAGGGVPLAGGKDEKGNAQSQMNLVQPDGTVVNIANVVPVTDAAGKPVYQTNPDGSVVKDDQGNPVPKTRWALNMKPPEDGGMPPELKATWMERVYDAHQAHIAAVTKKREEAVKKGETPPPLPDPIPELAGYTPPPKTA